MWWNYGDWVVFVFGSGEGGDVIEVWIDVGCSIRGGGYIIYVWVCFIFGVIMVVSGGFWGFWVLFNLGVICLLLFWIWIFFWLEIGGV